MKRIIMGYLIGSLMSLALSVAFFSPRFTLQTLPFADLIGVLLLILGMCLGVRMAKLDIERVRNEKRRKGGI